MGRNSYISLINIIQEKDDMLRHVLFMGLGEDYTKWALFFRNNNNLRGRHTYDKNISDFLKGEYFEGNHWRISEEDKWF